MATYDIRSIWGKKFQDLTSVVGTSLPPKDIRPEILPIKPSLQDDLQVDIDNCQTLRADQLDKLLQEVAGTGDARATVYIYDIMKAKGYKVTPAGWNALKILEGKRSDKIIYRVPPSTARTLTPSRRIHKICKGVRLHDRSEAAKDIMPAAIDWLHRNRAAVEKMDRISAAKMLMKEVGVSLECARGAITKLKQKGLYSN